MRSLRQRVIQSQQEIADLLTGTSELPVQRSHEYGVQIIEAIETGEPASINGNVPNDHLIGNLPEGCCVEVPCLVNDSGV